MYCFTSPCEVFCGFFLTLWFEGDDKTDDHERWCRAGVTQSEKCLTTEWTTGVRSPAEDFSNRFCVQTGSGAHPASCTMGTGGKARPGRDADHSPPSSAEVKNGQELYLLSPQAPPWRVAGSLRFNARWWKKKHPCICSEWGTGGWRKLHNEELHGVYS
jgi:hypothetical protein